MVVAEVPLWVIHKKSDGLLVESTTTGANISTGTSSDCSREKAELSVELWQQQQGNRFSSSLSKSSSFVVSKCPIYSIDCYGPLFATGGGDGAVRVWTTSALFRSNVKPGKVNEESGGYVSNSGSSASSVQSEKEEDEKTAGATTMNGEKNDGDDSSNGGGLVSEEDSSSSTQDIAIHDLSSLVRRKKGAAHAANANGNDVVSPESPSPARAEVTCSTDAAAPTPSTKVANTTATLSSSPPRSPHHHHHPNKHRLITTLTGHSGHSVLAVRFSSTGKYVATGGDDCLVLVYSVPPSAMTNSASPSHHHGHTHSSYWPRLHLCTGHALDVVDLAWSPDDSHLVSCSLDSASPICVWKIPSNNTASATHKLLPFKVLGATVHTSCVRGVTFDPAGSYFCSSGDDPAVCIWRAHDDWGLERRITQIFSQNDTRTCSVQQPSFVRRSSWSTDGGFLCCTNAVVKNKHVAATISRQGWAVASSDGGGGGRGGGGPSSPTTTATGAANLVGHKQPVVACRHSPRLLHASKKRGDEEGESEKEEEQELQYATLLALGDKQGFVTVWTTKQSRPIFKMQCASRTTVTDLAWGVLGSGGRSEELFLLISQLDGAVTSIKFRSSELPPLLTAAQQARVFQMKYGMDAGSSGLGSILVGHSTQQSKFIESALSMVQNEEEDHMEEDEDSNDQQPMAEDDEPVKPQQLPPQEPSIATTGGKKRVRPVLISVGATSEKSASSSSPPPAPKRRRSIDPVQNAMEAAERAATAAAAAQQKQGEAAKETDTTSAPQQSTPGPQPQQQTPHVQEGTAASVVTGIASSVRPVTYAIPYNTDRIHSVELPIKTIDSSLDSAHLGTNVTQAGLVAECVNSSKIPTGSSGEAVLCIDLVIRRDGRLSWRDQIPGTNCCALAASQTFVAVGTVDGTIQLYGSSPSLGWKGGQGFRSHPPLIIGHPIVSLRLDEKKDAGAAGEKCVEMLVVASDGAFAVYDLLPHLRLQYKGSTLPALTHMALSCQTSQHPSRGEQIRLPELSRIQFTESGHLFLLLGYGDHVRKPAGDGSAANAARGVSASQHPSSVGGSLQGFVYDRLSELWMRVADSRFVLSDLYSGLPAKTKRDLSRLDDAVRLGSINSLLKAAHRGRLQSGGHHGDSIFRQEESDMRNFLATRSHCEDRMACALTMKSASEFKVWLGLYVRTLSIAGQSDSIRMLADMLLGVDGVSGSECSCWWLCLAPQVLGMDRKSLIKSVVLPELRKNLALQRLTNEIALEV